MQRGHFLGTAYYFSRESPEGLPCSSSDDLIPIVLVPMTVDIISFRCSPLGQMRPCIYILWTCYSRISYVSSGGPF